MNLVTGSFSVVEGGEGGNCSKCNRLRLTANGLIKPCLFNDLGYNVREHGIEKAYQLALENKPKSGSYNKSECFYNLGGIIKSKAMKELSHTDKSGKAKMVDVSHKPNQVRTAKAIGQISLQPETIQLIKDNEIKKGDVLTIAEIAGIQGGKRTSELIPLCHPLQISKIECQGSSCRRLRNSRKRSQMHRTNRH